MRGREGSWVAMDPLCTVNFVNGQYQLVGLQPPTLVGCIWAVG